MITVPDVSNDRGNKEEWYISPQCLTTIIPFQFYNLTLSYSTRRFFSLCCFDMPGCLVAVVEKKRKGKKKTPVAPTGV